MKNFKYVFVAVVGALATCALCVGTVVMFQNNHSSNVDAIEIADEEYYVEDEFYGDEEYYGIDDYDDGDYDLSDEGMVVDEGVEGYETDDIVEEE